MNHDDLDMMDPSPVWNDVDLGAGEGGDALDGHHIGENGVSGVIVPRTHNY